MSCWLFYKTNRSSIQYWSVDSLFGKLISFILVLNESLLNFLLRDRFNFILSGIVFEIFGFEVWNNNKNLKN